MFGILKIDYSLFTGKVFNVRGTSIAKAFAVLDSFTNREQELNQLREEAARSLRDKGIVEALKKLNEERKICPEM